MYFIGIISEERIINISQIAKYRAHMHSQYVLSRVWCYMCLYACLHHVQFQQTVIVCVTSLSKKKSTSMRMRFPLGLLLPRRFASASSACGSWRLNNLMEREVEREREGKEERHAGKAYTLLLNSK